MTTFNAWLLRVVIRVDGDLIARAVSHAAVEQFDVDLVVTPLQILVDRAIA